MNSSSEAADSPEKLNKDANQNVFSMTVEEDEEKNTSERMIVDTEDNWIGKFLYGGPIGYVVNFSSLIATTIFLVIYVRYMLNDEECYRTIVQPYWFPTIVEFFAVLFPMDILMCTFLVLIVYPLSRVSRSTVYYWFLGLSSSCVMLAAIWPVKQYLSILGLKGLLFTDWCRMSMKMASFLVECSKNDQVHKKSSMKSFLYFICIPTLVYKHQYPLARRIRWLKVLCHLWWLFAGGLSFSLLGFQVGQVLRIDLFTIDLKGLVLFAFYSALMALPAYPFVVWFFIFENFCGFHGEILRYPNLKFFGAGAELMSDPSSAVNTIASKWLSRYIYIPVVKSSGSRIKAMWLTFSLSLPIHDLGVFYSLHIVLAINFIAGISLFPLFLTVQPKRRVYQMFWFPFIFLFWLTWMVSYPLEFIAWNYSSMPDIDKLSIIRPVPLFVEQLYHNFFASSM